MTEPTHLYAALRHPTEPRILLLPNEHGWQLPYAHHPEEFWYANVPIVNKTFGAQLNTPLWTLRQFYCASDQEKKEETVLFEVILLDRAWQPPHGTRWVNAAEFGGLPFTQPDLAPALTAYLTALATGTVPDQRPAWARVGWEEEVRAWISDELARHGHTLRGLEQLKQWGISSVLRAKTDGKDFYFKTTNPLMTLFVNEACVTQRLSALFPAYIPAPLSVDIDRDWMLLAEFDQLFQRDMPIETKAEAFRRFAELQIQTIGQEEALLAAGCLDRRVDVMLAQLDPLLADPTAMHKLTSEQAVELRELAPKIKALLLQLATCNLPPTLVHGDLHLGNAALVNGQTIYFDWTDACLAHPFIDLHSLMWVKDETHRETILTAYLEPWTAFAPLPRLREIFRLAYALLPLHHAVSYIYIVNNLEPDSKPELDMTHEFLEQLRVRVKEYLLKGEES
ncbi:MAG: aminoglycoside phosphotransferase family protein [Anaerolineales bacterium]|nr:aminoglycoside phosphotransferase family protein [Anaerolineales bacterium]